MATLWNEQRLPGRAVARPSDPHVFFSVTGRRARLLQAAGVAVGLAALAWLAALGFALLGVGKLPGLVTGTKTPRPDPAAVRTPQARPAVSALRAGAEVNTSQSRPAPATTHRPAVQVSTTPAAAPTTAPAAPPVTAPTQGWAKHGSTAPPGQAKRTQQPSPGNGHGRDTAPGQSATPPGHSGSHTSAKG
jgi:hypothetical protein